MEEKRVSKRTNKGPWKHSVLANRRKAAEERQAKYDKLTVQEKLANLDQLGLRAVKERAKLNAKIEGK